MVIGLISDNNIFHIFKTSATYLSIYAQNRKGKYFLLQITLFTHNTKLNYLYITLFIHNIILFTYNITVKIYFIRIEVDSSSSL